MRHIAQHRNSYAIRMPSEWCWKPIEVLPQLADLGQNGWFMNAM